MHYHDPKIKKKIRSVIVKNNYLDRVFLSYRDASMIDKGTNIDKRRGSGPGLEKRKTSEILITNNHFNKCLDLYAGAGISAYLFSKYIESITAIEKEDDTFELLQQNLKDVNNIELFHADNMKWLDSNINNLRDYDYFDLDPFGDPGKRLDIILNNIDSGVITITQGMLYAVESGSISAIRVYGEGVREFWGRKCWRWTEDFYIPLLKEKYPDIEIFHWFVFPYVTRLFISKNFEVSSKTLQLLAERQRYFGHSRRWRYNELGWKSIRKTRNEKESC